MSTIGECRFKEKRLLFNGHFLGKPGLAGIWTKCHNICWQQIWRYK